MPLTPGTRLGPYEVIVAIGAGGMGEVYRARDTRLGREVAVKVLPSSFSADRDRLRRFEQEARAAGALNHPNILAIHDIGTHAGAPFIVSELLEGETLRQRLAESPVPLRKALDFAVQIANGLAAAHEKGITHRDLKPENLFVTKDGRIKILDFGLAKLERPEPAAGATQTAATLAIGEDLRTDPGAVLGTTGYMSPEQVRGRPVDQRADIFSLGAVLYEMVSGQRPFRGESSVETMNAILKEDPPDLSAMNRNVPPSLERLIRRCLEKSPDERFQSARDLGFALEAASGTSSSIARPAIDAAREPRWKWLVPAAVLALVVLVGAGSYFTGVWKGKQEGIAGTSFRRLNFQDETIFNARFAPDGETVIYSAAPEGNVPELFIHRPDYPAPQPLGLRDTHLLSVSSKGELAILTNAKYVALRLFTGTLAVVALGGGAPREILQGVREADWSPDGANLAIIRELQGKDRLEFPVGKVLYESDGYLSDVRFSPRGDRIAFFEHPVRYDNRGSVDVVDLQGHRTLLSDGYAGEDGIAWAPGGNEVYFSGWTSGDSKNLMRAVSLSAKLRTVLRTPGDLMVLDTASDGRFLIAHLEYQDRIRALAPGANVEQDMSWLDNSIFPVLSRDGRLLLFTDDDPETGANYALCLRKTDGSPVVRLGDGNAGDLSPDQRWALSVVPSSPMRLVLYPTGAGEPRPLERGNIEQYESARFFPDGKRILACGQEPGRTPRCYIQDLAGGSPRPVTPEGTTNGLVLPDGNSLLVQSADETYLLYPVAGGEPRKLPWLASDDEVIRWMPDGLSLLVYRRGQIPARVERMELSTGRRVLLNEIAPADRAGVLRIRFINFSDDMRSHAYSYTRVLSSLVMVKGVR
jgi:WD40 repeat protein